MSKLTFLPILHAAPHLGGAISITTKNGVAAAAIAPEYFEMVTRYKDADAFNDWMANRAEANATQLINALAEVSPALAKWATDAIEAGREPEDLADALTLAVAAVDKEKAGA